MNVTYAAVRERERVDDKYLRLGLAGREFRGNKVGATATTTHQVLPGMKKPSLPIYLFIHYYIPFMYVSP